MGHKPLGLVKTNRGTCIFPNYPLILYFKLCNMGLLLLAVVGIIISLASYGISNVVYKRFVRAGKGNASVIQVVTFILSFLLLFIGIAALFFYNVRFER